MAPSQQLNTPSTSIDSAMQPLNSSTTSPDFTSDDEPIARGLRNPATPNEVRYLGIDREPTKTLTSVSCFSPSLIPKWEIK
jgi:hypothetical protein